MTLKLDGELLLLGAGNMGGAMLTGWLAQGLDPKSVLVQDPAPPPAIAALLSKHGIKSAPKMPHERTRRCSFCGIFNRSKTRRNTNRLSSERLFSSAYAAKYSLPRSAPHVMRMKTPKPSASAIHTPDQMKAAFFEL